MTALHTTATDEIQFSKGCRVSHPDFGEGVIVNPHGRNGWIIVNFDDGTLEAKCSSNRVRPI